MAKETTIKLSLTFKSFLRGEKQGDEDFEATIKRLISNSIPQEKQSKRQYTREVIIPKTETIEVKEIKSNIQVKQLPYKLPINKI